MTEEKGNEWRKESVKRVEELLSKDAFIEYDDRAFKYDAADRTAMLMSGDELLTIGGGFQTTVIFDGRRISESEARRLARSEANSRALYKQE